MHRFILDMSDLDMEPTDSESCSCSENEDGVPIFNAVTRDIMDHVETICQQVMRDLVVDYYRGYHLRQGRSDLGVRCRDPVEDFYLSWRMRTFQF